METEKGSNNETKFYITRERFRILYKKRNESYKTTDSIESDN